MRANKKKREQERERETDRENRGKIKKGDYRERTRASKKRRLVNRPIESNRRITSTCETVENGDSN